MCGRVTARDAWRSREFQTEGLWGRQQGMGGQSLEHGAQSGAWVECGEPRGSQDTEGGCARLDCAGSHCSILNDQIYFFNFSDFH